MKYSVETGSVVMIYTPSYIKTDSGIQMLVGGIQRHTDNMVILS
jgi:hypothetical protein